MELSEYQSRAIETQVPQRGDPISFYIHGLAGEVGSIAAEYKKRLRDGASHEGFIGRIAEELGDVLWYLASLAHTLDLDLGQLADRNLAKARDRWIGKTTTIDFDEKFPSAEQFPRDFTVVFKPDEDRVRVFDPEGTQIGDQLTDNSRYPDGYRFHDVIHLAHAAVLGWSPTLRAMLKRKRKSDTLTDEAEDGARAIFAEEAVAIAVFEYARRHKFLEGLDHIDSELLSFIQTVVSQLEVAARSGSDWEAAIIQAFEVWRFLVANNGGTVRCDLDAQAISVVLANE